MNAINMTILLIVSISLAAGAATIYSVVLSDAQPEPEQLPTAYPRLLSAELLNTSDESASIIRFQITSDEPIRLDQTSISLTTDQDVAYLSYRDGLLIRNVSSGFYTQS